MMNNKKKKIYFCDELRFHDDTWHALYDVNALLKLRVQVSLNENISHTHIYIYIKSSFV